MRSRGAALLSLVSLVGLAGCGPLGPKPDEADPEPVSARIVTTERGSRGGHLVVLKEDGTRLADLTKFGSEPAVDSHPVFSPDGRFVVFASTRQRARLGRTSLWVVEAKSGSEPRRLTASRAVDRDPLWAPDGSGLVYASNTGESFDLWFLPIERDREDWPRAAGEPRRLTEAETDELSPSLSPDGETLVYMAVEPDQRSTLWTLPLAGGTPEEITDGPADLTPSWSPGGDTIAFAGPIKGRGDTDLFAVDADGENRRLLVDEPLSDQTGPLWSEDGRYLFATSVFRSVKSGAPVLASLVVLDTRADSPSLRALHDPVAVESRIGVALAPRALDSALLRQNPPYAQALRRAVKKRLDELRFEEEERRRRERERERDE